MKLFLIGDIVSGNMSANITPDKYEIRFLKHTKNVLSIVLIKVL
jgi:hypothetical protein